MPRFLKTLALCICLAVCPRAFAALAIDASTPAAVHGNSSSKTAVTASFTPPANSVILVLTGVNATLSSNSLAVSDNLGSHLTYHLINQEGNVSNDSLVYAWWATNPSATAMTITVTDSTSDNVNLYIYEQVIVFTGGDTTNGVGAHGGNRGATGAISDNYSSTVNGSWGWLLCADFSAQTFAATGETIQDHYEVSGQITYAVIRKNSTTASSGTSVAMTTSAPTSGAQISHIYIEVIPPAGAVVIHRLTTLGVG